MATKHRFKFSIVTAVYNQLDYTQLFFKSIKNNSSLPYELVVVDNGSSEPTKSWLKQQKIDKLIRWEQNLGTTKAWNEAIKVARGEFVCVINNDVFVSPRWLEGLENVLNNAPEDLATLSPSTNDVTYSLKVNLDQNGHNDFCQEAVYYQNQAPILWSYSLIGSCIVLTHETIKKIGLFDERYFAYYNDLDYSLSITASGLKAYTTNQSTIYHFGGASGKNNATISIKKEEDKKKFLTKWAQVRSFLNVYFEQLT